MVTNQKHDRLKSFLSRHGIYNKGILLVALVGIISVFMKWLPFSNGFGVSSGYIVVVAFAGILIVAFIPKISEKFKLYFQSSFGIIVLFLLSFSYYNFQQIIYGTQVIEGRGGLNEGMLITNLLSHKFGFYLAFFCALAIVGLSIHKMKISLETEQFSKSMKILGFIAIIILIVVVVSRNYFRWL